MSNDSGPNLPPFPSSYGASGLLLHVTSLPSSYGIGDVGPAAIAWIDQLSDAGQTWWQALPSGPTGNAAENPWRRWIDTALDARR
jgi:4-alpha-glucanotransferase